ncbi:MAG: PA domain-containing protein [Bacteroidota bacterium]
MTRLLRHLLLVLVAVPGLATAQGTAPNAVLDVGFGEYPAQATKQFGAQFEDGAPFGPYEFAQAIDAGGDGTTFDGCEPFENADEVAGNIALISRGACAFVTKAENAANAGAVAFIVYMDEREGPDDLVTMGGTCDPSVCSAPGLYITRRTFEDIIDRMKFGLVGTIKVTFPVLPSTGSVETGIVNLPIYDNGFFGANETFGPSLDEAPFTFNGFTPLYVGSVLVGIDGNVAGSPYEGVSEYVADGPVITGTSGGFNEAALATFESEGLGVAVENLVYAREGDPFIYMRINVANTTDEALDDVYLGLLADWDVDDDGPGGPDDSTNDFGGWDNDLLMAYVFDEDRAQYYGLMHLAAPFSRPNLLAGYATEVDLGDDALLFAALTSPNPPSSEETQRASVVGLGPCTLPANGSAATGFFALVAGESEAALRANAEAATRTCATGACRLPESEALASLSRNVSADCSSPVTTDEDAVPPTHRLASIYPNPVATTAQVGFTLPTAEEAAVEVFDLLGRRVATLTEGLRAAGEHSVTLDAAGLPSGVYVVRLATPSVTLTERVTVVR